MARVFVVNEPLRKNHETGAYERFLPMESAANFGEVVKLTPDGSPPGNLAAYLTMIEDGILDINGGWSDGDFLVLVGDQALLAYAAMLIGRRIESYEEQGDPSLRLRVLKWERRLEAYAPLILGDNSPVATRAESR